MFRVEILQHVVVALLSLLRVYACNERLVNENFEQHKQARSQGGVGPVGRLPPQIRPGPLFKVHIFVS